MQPGTAICTWFVADDSENATFFPQVGGRSDGLKTQAVYWRCAVGFFASSLVQNPAAKHLFFTNTGIPRIDGIDLEALFRRWGVEVITLPITYRLPNGSVGSWGNQFYIFDVLDWFAMAAVAKRLIVLDSDCLWLRPVTEMERAIDAHGALTYELGRDEHPHDEAINGLSRQGMARFLRRSGGTRRDAIPYFGGEIFAASLATTQRIAARARALWPEVVQQSRDAPREEAHLLSVIYALEVIKPATANRFIRRMWTTFHHHNLAPDDCNLTLWHLPAEKKTGFSDLFKRITANPNANPARDAAAMGLDGQSYARDMGWPRRRPIKFVRDLGLKVAERLRG